MSVFYSDHSDIILATLSILLMWGGITCIFISREQDIPWPFVSWKHIGVALLMLALRETIGVSSLSVTSFSLSYPLASLLQMLAGFLIVFAAYRAAPPISRLDRVVRTVLYIFLALLTILVLHPLVVPAQFAHFGRPSMSPLLFLLVKVSLCPAALLLLVKGFSTDRPHSWNARLFLVVFFLHILVIALCRPPALPDPPRMVHTPSVIFSGLFIFRVLLAFSMAALAWDVYSRSLGAVANVRWWPLLFTLCFITASLLFVLVSTRNYSSVVRKNILSTVKNRAAVIPAEALLRATQSPGAANSVETANAIFGAARKLDLFKGYSRITAQVDAIAAPGPNGRPRAVMDVATPEHTARWTALLPPLATVWEQVVNEGLYVHDTGVGSASPLVYITPVHDGNGTAVGAAVLSLNSVQLARDRYMFKRPLLLMMPVVLLLVMLIVSGQQRSWLATHASDRAKAVRRGTLSNDLSGIVVLTGTDSDAVIVDVNPRFADVLGTTPETFIGKAPDAVFDFATPEGPERVRMMCAAPVGKCIANLELALLRSDGKTVHLLVHGRPLTDNPEETQYVWQCVDITKIKAMENEVVAARDLQQLILDTIPEAVFVKDAQGRYIHSNKAFKRFLHLDEEETAIGRRLGQIHPRESVLAEANDQICRDLDGETHVYTQDFEFSGEKSFWEVSKTLRRIGDRGEIIVGCVHDLTSRKEIEDAISGERHFLHQVINSLPVSVCFVDTDRVVQVCDEDFCRASGFGSPGELAGRQFDDVSPFGASDRREDESLLACGDGHRDNHIEIADGDHIRHFMVRRSVMSSSDGRTLGLVKSFSETTQLVAANRAARQAERAKAAFLANMSHELRTPMNGIVGMADLIIDHRATEPLQRLHAETIVRSAKTLQMVIDEVLDIATLDDGTVRFQPHPAPFPLLALAEESVQIVTCIVEAWGVELSLNYDFSLKTVYDGDARHLRQIMVQMLTHCSRVTRDKQIRLAVENAGEGMTGFRVAFRAADGVDAKRIEEMFKNPDAAGEQARNAANLGIFNDRIGLPLAWRLISTMDGRLQVTDNGDLVQCEVVLPLAAGRDEQLLAPAFSGSRMLVATALPERSRAIADCLDFAGAEVVRADTAEDVRVELRTAADAGRHFELVVLDGALASQEGLPEFVAEVNNHFEGSPDGANIILAVSSAQVQQFALPPNAVKFLMLPPVCPSELWYKAEICMHGFSREPMRFRRRSTRLTRLMKIPANVLLVEDNSVNQMVAMAILKRIGCRTTLAKDGREAVDLIIRHKREFDLILMDCMMPVMDGYEATTNIRMHERAKGTERNIIIALTANSLAGDREKCLASGMDDYMTKPVTLERIRDCLLKYCPILATMVDQAGDAAG